MDGRRKVEMQPRDSAAGPWSDGEVFPQVFPQV